jgi:uncharacterized membrane protein
MTLLILGLVLFLGVHSVRIVAEPWRTAQIARRGEGPWKGVYSLASLAGLALIIWGYADARGMPTLLWVPPTWARHAAALLTLPGFVLVTAAYVPGNRIKAAIGHPMIVGVKLWAFAHLVANGTLHALLLFGAFLTWAVLDYAAARRRDRVAGTTRAAGSVGRDLVTVAIGAGAWALFALLLHGVLIGVRPFG